MTKKKKQVDRPKYIIEVRRNWRFGPHCHFWDILQWKESDLYEEGGYWGMACEGGVAFTKRGMWRAVNKRLKKLGFGFETKYYNLDKSIFEGIV